MKAGAIMRRFIYSAPMTLEEIENMRKRLIFRSEHRGTKEMDLLLGSFARRYVPEFSEVELLDYQELLQNNDPDLYNWITGQEAPPAQVTALAFFERLAQHQYAG
jgi:antitoxin CptB